MQDSKRTYEKAESEVILFDECDVITTSNRGDQAPLDPLN